MATIGAAYPGYTFGPVGAAGKLLQAVDDNLRRIGISLVPGKRETHDALNGSFPVRDIGSHTSKYVCKCISDCMNAPP
jgi:hypothetical protein